MGDIQIFFPPFRRLTWLSNFRRETLCRRVNSIRRLNSKVDRSRILLQNRFFVREDDKYFFFFTQISKLFDST